MSRNIEYDGGQPYPQAWDAHTLCVKATSKAHMPYASTTTHRAEAQLLFDTKLRFCELKKSVADGIQQPRSTLDDPADLCFWKFQVDASHLTTCSPTAPCNLRCSTLAADAQSLPLIPGTTRRCTCLQLLVKYIDIRSQALIATQCKHIILVKVPRYGNRAYRWPPISGNNRFTAASHEGNSSQRGSEWICA